MRSPKNRNNPPVKKPIVTIRQLFISNLDAISNAGFSKDQNVAAIMTPAANPNIASIMVLFGFLKKKTRAAPNAVILQVKVAAIIV